jgi:hypothetical protein
VLLRFSGPACCLASDRGSLHPGKSDKQRRRDSRVLRQPSGSPQTPTPPSSAGSVFGAVASVDWCGSEWWTRGTATAAVSGWAGQNASGSRTSKTWLSLTTLVASCRRPASGGSIGFIGHTPSHVDSLEVEDSLQVRCVAVSMRDMLGARLCAGKLMRQAL